MHHYCRNTIRHCEWIGRDPNDHNKASESFVLREMGGGGRRRGFGGVRKLRQLNSRDGLLSRCVWFTCHIFLRQCWYSAHEIWISRECAFSRLVFLAAANFPHDNNSVRLFSIILWLSSTYVLSGFYSAQLTSQLARPSKEPPISTLLRLEHVLNLSQDAYRLLAEKNSASHNVLMNGTGIMQRLYGRMVQQGHDGAHLLSSVEEGVQMLLVHDKTVVFAGRQTLFFNMKRFGIQNFQLSEKLFTRYSAISLQKGCLFLDNLNEKYKRIYCNNFSFTANFSDSFVAGGIACAA